MERRYKLMSKLGVRNLAGYNNKIDEAAKRDESCRIRSASRRTSRNRSRACRTSSS